MSRHFASRSRLCRVGVGGLAIFGGIVLAQHALQHNLSPRTHEVSEYVNGNPGWLMVLGFLSWSASLAASAALAAEDRNPAQHATLAWSRVLFLGLAATGILITACFATQTTAGKLPPGVRLGLSGQLHDVGSGLATLALVGAAVASIANRDGSGSYRRRTAAILLVALVGDVALLAVGPGVGGIRQRILLACAGAWQLLALRAWKNNAKPEDADAIRHPHQGRVSRRAGSGPGSSGRNASLRPTEGTPPTLPRVLLSDQPMSRGRLGFGDGIGVWFSGSGVESLVRPGGWRRVRRFAGSTGASNVAFRGITPDPATAIQAVTGSGVDAGRSGDSLNQQ